jgi:hypothetical protein
MKWVVFVALAYVTTPDPVVPKPPVTGTANAGMQNTINVTSNRARLAAAANLFFIEIS